MAVLQKPTVLEGVLRPFDLLRGLTDAELDRVVAGGRLVTGRRGEVLLGEGASAEAIFLVLRGRVEVALVQASGGLRVFGQLGPGDHFGELGLLTGGRLATAATAATDVALLRIEKGLFDALLRGVPAFAENLSRSLGLRLVSAGSGRLRRPLPGIIGLACASPRTFGLVEGLARALAERDAPFVVATPEPLGERGAGIAPQVHLEGLGSLGERRDAMVKRIAELRTTSDLVLVWLEEGLESRPEDPRLVHCEELWWVVDAEAGAQGMAGLEQLLARRPTLQQRTRLVWALREDERPPRCARPAGLLAPELRVFLPDSGPAKTRRQKLSIRRLVGYLEGARIGLALGGGGARGLAHCGVLRVLEEEGIAVDRIAGTSMGALVGFLYASGMPPDEVLLRVSSEASAPLALRLLPTGRYLNFWLKARTGSFERSIRKYMGHITFPELDVPLQTVTSDLIQGEPVIRETGDCVDAVIESINLPIFSRPILRDGRALVDGGVLNNLPIDLLLAQQIEAILAVDVLAPAGESSKATRPIGMLESLLRIAELQHKRLTSQRAGQADLLLRVDVGRFNLTDFAPAHAKEIAALGELAARHYLEALRALVPARWRGRP